MENYLQRLAQVWGPDANDPATARQWIEATVANQTEEGLYLDFKQKSDNNERTPNDDDKANLAKAISGFANTDGGLIIWGVRAKPEHKDDPDVATELRPISNLRVFHTRLNDLSGQLVIPPVGGVENRLVPQEDGGDRGYVVSIIPKRRDTLVQANAKTCKGFFIRSGSGFHHLPEPLIAEFYKRKASPLLRIVLRLGQADQAKFVEDRIPAQPGDGGLCKFCQSAEIEWNAYLRNEGLGSEINVALELSVSESGKWNIITTRDLWRHQAALIVSCFVQATGRAFGKVVEPIHPGQETRVAYGVLRVPLNAVRLLAFEAQGSAYATDSPPFDLRDPRFPMNPDEFVATYREAFENLRKDAPPAQRVIPSREIMFDEGDLPCSGS